MRWTPIGLRPYSASGILEPGPCSSQRRPWLGFAAACCRLAAISGSDWHMQRIGSGELHSTYTLGDLRIISLRDGYVDMPLRRLRQPGDKPIGDALKDQISLVDGQLRLSVNAFAIDDGSAISLIDTGASNAWHPTMGRLPEALDEAGIEVATSPHRHVHAYSPRPHPRPGASRRARGFPWDDAFAGSGRRTRPLSRRSAARTLSRHGAIIRSRRTCRHKYRSDRRSWP